MSNGYAKPEYKNMSILVIDDDVMVTRIVEHILKEMGFQDVQSTLYPKTGLALISDSDNMGKPFDLVICDWMMPEISGIEMLKWVRSRNMKLPFIMLTARTTEDAVEEAHGLDVDAYIAKPFTANQVQLKVSTIAQRILRSRQAEAK